MTSIDFVGGVACSLVMLVGGGGAVAGVGCVVQRSAPRLSLAWSLALAHTGLLVLVTLPYRTELFVPAMPFDDLYAAFLWIPGWHIYGPALAIAHAMAPSLLAPGSTLEHLSNVERFHVLQVFIPGIAGVVAGGAQWYGIGRLVQFLHARRERSKNLVS